MNVHFSSKTDLHSTPQEFFEGFNFQYGFTLDVCATKENAKCKIFFDVKRNGLIQNWGENICWMNPPYGRTIGLWMRKAYLASTKGATVVCLVPSRTDTNWWHDWAMKGKIEFIRGRLKFGNAKNTAPFPSAVVVFSPL